jgi:hypothetical protein
MRIPLRLSLVLFLAACSSSSSTPKPDGGDGGPDAPQSEVGPDSNKQDSDAPDPDAPDADAHASDGGDASADGNAVSCDDALHDPVLGTARLGNGFRVFQSAVLPVTSWLPVAVVDESVDGGVALVVYGYNGDGRVHRLGVWPNLSAPAASNLVFDAVSTADRARQVVITPSLVTTHGRLLAGYRTIQGGAFATGGVSIFDTAQPTAAPRWLAAPGIEAALGLGSYFLVGGDGLGGATGVRGVYFVGADDPKSTPGLLAKYPAVTGDVVRPGPMSVSSNGVVALGDYLDGADRHAVRLPEPALVTDSLSGGATIDLASAQELAEDEDVVNLTSFGPGLAALRTKKARGILPALGQLDFHALARPGGDAGTTVGPPVTILSASDDCTAVSQLVPVTGGLSMIVGLWDRNGQRLVRLIAQ